MKLDYDSNQYPIVLQPREPSMDDRTKFIVGVVPVDTLGSESGLEFLRGVIDGRHPVPPIADLIGFSLTEVEFGRAVFTGTPEFKHYNPLGTVHGGYAATLLDSCMGCCVHATLPIGVGYTTLEFKVTLIRAITAETGPVKAEGRILSSGRRAATAEGRLTDAKGRLLAHGTTTCLVFDLPSAEKQPPSKS
jgi:uncharacterized protein (TIGR00369 family)